MTRDVQGWYKLRDSHASSTIGDAGLEDDFVQCLLHVGHYLVIVVGGKCFEFITLGVNISGTF